MNEFDNIYHTDEYRRFMVQKEENISDLFSKYRLSEALMEVYNLLRDEFSSWYLEMIKPAYGTPMDKTTYEATLSIFEKLLQLLHPFMPFITEELWQHLRRRKHHVQYHGERSFCRR